MSPTVCRSMVILVFTGCMSDADDARPDAPLRDLLEHYCTDCHGGGIEKGGLDLELLLDQPLSQHTATWEKAILRLDTRQMPPPDEPRPTEEEYQHLVDTLTGHFDHQAAASPQPVRGETIRRLTRTEYRHVVRDLLAVDIDVTELLPKDDASHGFDNVTVSNLSPTLLNRYLSAAQKISKLAVGTPPKSPAGRIVRLPPDRTQEQHVPGLPVGTRGGTRIPHTFPATGEYEITVRLTRDRNESVEGLREPHELEILLDKHTVQTFTVKPPKGRDYSQVDAHLTCRIPVKAGAHDLAVTFRAKPPKLSEQKREPYDASYNMHRHPRQSPAVYQVSIVGPFGEAFAGNTASRRLLFGQRTLPPKNQAQTAREVLRPILRNAYRRPVTDADLAGPLAFFHEARQDGFEAGIEAALSAILASPRFLLRIENDPAHLPPDTPYPLDDFALASRLSFFLWSSLPDNRLLDLAEAGTLSQPKVLAAEARRMLNDPRADSLVTNFAAQWLHLPNLESVKPDLRLFPDFDDNLRDAMRTETEMLCRTIMRDDRSVLDLLRADFTFVNERLAKHYEMPGIQGSRFRRVALGPDSHRGGLLRQGSILAVTSYANRTSPVLRGNWILENIIGTPTPPPPPNVPALDDTVVSANLPMRERLALHSSRKSCATCHVLMDPIGFSLENYDATGRWRLYENERPVDSAGGLPDGRRFDGIDPMIDGLLERPDLFARTLTGKLLIYALGRGLTPSDQPAIRAIVRDAAESDYQFSALITGVVQSTPFTMNRTR